MSLVSLSSLSPSALVESHTITLSTTTLAAVSVLDVVGMRLTSVGTAEVDHSGVADVSSGVAHVSSGVAHVVFASSTACPVDNGRSRILKYESTMYVYEICIFHDNVRINTYIKI